ncbi:MAG: hypothetical protein KC464_17470 [Myxococcales bacterium]|nr:hypothetical protein [Myxococcales bacterium]
MKSRTALVALVAIAASAAPACGDDPVSVKVADRAAYQREELMEAVATFARGPRTPEAFGVLAAEVTRLRPRMDELVAAEAELQLTVLAVDAIAAVDALPWAQRTERLATTVWPVALAPPIEAVRPDGWRSTREQSVDLHPDDTAATYVRRLCEGAYVVECKHVVPELQGAVLGTIAISRLTERARAAVQDCDRCAGDPRWSDAVARWRGLDADARVARHRAEEAGATSRWPVAGAASRDWPPTSLLTVEDDGDWSLDGVVLDPGRRVEALAAARGDAAILGVHVTPDTNIGALEAVIGDAGQAGYLEIALQARVPAYPWDLRAYRLEAPRPVTRGARRAPVHLGRPGDPVQVLLRTLDGRVKPDEVARDGRPGGR